MKLKGKAWKFPRDDINTGLIRKQIYNPLPIAEQSKHCLESLDPTFASRVQPGDFIVAGKNFGCGSSTPAHLSILGLGIPVVVAESFGPLFMSNCIGGGLWPVVCADVLRHVETGDVLEFDTQTGELNNVTRKTRLQAKQLHVIHRAIVEAGGEKVYLKQRIGQERGQ